MDYKRWRQIETIFFAALERPRAERRAFISEACAEDRELFSEVDSLLSAEELSENFLDESDQSLGLKILADSFFTLQTGQKLSRYTIEKPIGRGGMGEVYLATDEKLNRKIALKLLPRELKNHLDLNHRFGREARAAAAISHPNIAHIYETGEAEGLSFIAMEYVEGETLREKLRREKRLSEREAVKIITQMTSALAAAHQAGVVHRDIKPENIILRPDGYVKVLDFGIAAQNEISLVSAESGETSGDFNQTESGMILGTVRYMSPEQARGEKTDGRADVWSLGVCLYEMLAGEAPFQGETRGETIEKILNREPAQLKAPNLIFTRPLQKILRRSLTKDLTGRYQTAAEMHSDLRSLTKTVKNDFSGKLLSLGAGNRSFLTIFLLTAAAVIISLVGFFFYNRAGVERKITTVPLRFQSSLLTDHGRVLCAAVSSDGKSAAYATEIDGRQAIFFRDLETGSDKELIAPSPTNDFEGACLSFSPDGKFVYYGSYENNSLVGTLYRVPVEDGESQFLLKGIDSPVSFSPDGSQMVFLVTTGDNENLVVARSDGTEPQTIVTRTRPQFLSFDNYPAWSPDGKNIAFAAGMLSGRRQVHVTLYEIETGNERNLTTEPLPDIRQLGWLPNGSGLIMTSGQTVEDSAQIHQISYPDGEISRLTDDLLHYNGISVARQSAKFAAVAAEDKTQVWLIEADGNPKTARQITSGENDAYGVAWLSDNQIVYESSAAGSLDLWVSHTDGNEIRQITDDKAFDYKPDVSSDGRYIVFSSNRGGVYNLWRINVDGTNLTQLTKGTGEFSPRISPDGRWVVYHRLSAGDPISVWKISIDGGAPIQLNTNPTSRPDVSPNGASVASTYRINSTSSLLIGIYPLDGTKTTKTLEPAEGMRSLIPMRWSPDGKAVIYVVRKNGVDNLWRQEIEGNRKPSQITNFDSDWIYSFDFSPDDKRIALSRGHRNSRALLFTEIK